MTVRRVPADFDSIQAAVEESRPGDTVRVAGGIYEESVVIGPGKDGLAYGNRASGNGGGLNSQGNDSLIIANRFVGNQSGLSLAASAGHLVYDNVLSRNTTRGANFLNVSGAAVLANAVGCNLQQGLRFDGGGGNRVVFNQVENNGAQGIDLEGTVDLSVVDQNEVEENGAAGIRVSSAAGRNAIRRNDLDGNRPDIKALLPFNLTNVYDENRCETSVPPGLCSCDD